MPYRMSGRFFEACDCYVPCPCWFDDTPDEDECTGLIAWQIENGEIDGVDVTGLSVVSVSQHGGHRATPDHARVVLLIDERADEERFELVRRAFTGGLGGPLGELAGMGGDHTAVEPARITFAVENDATRLEVPRRVAVRAATVRGSTKKPITIGDGLLATLLGSPGIVGRSSRYRLSVGAAAVEIDVEGRSTTSGRFAYAHRG
jgi:hypothetical protein